MMGNGRDIDDDPIPISLVANYIFCPRRAWLESVGERVESGQMAQGMYDHRNVDDANTDASLFRSVEVRHRKWGVCGKLDAVQITEEGILIREYKATPVKKAMIVTEAMRIQLALQSACLQDMGYHISGT